MQKSKNKGVTTHSSLLTTDQSGTDREDFLGLYVRKTRPVPRGSSRYGSHRTPNFETFEKGLDEGFFKGLNGTIRSPKRERGCANLFGTPSHRVINRYLIYTDNTSTLPLRQEVEYIYDLLRS